MSNEMDNSVETGALRARFLAYVSGSLPEAERDAFEERLLAEQELSDAVKMLEFELLDELAAGTLPADEQRIVADWARGSEMRQRQARVSRLLTQGKVSRSGRLSWKAAGFLLMAASLAVAAVLVVWRQERLLHPSGVAQSTAQAVPSASSSGSTTPFSAPVSARVKPDTILLVAERLRGSEDAPQVYRIHKDTPLRVQVIVPPSSDDTAYSLHIKRLGDARFGLERDAVKPSVVGGLRFVDVLFPQNALDAGSYVAVLRGASGAWTSRFSVAWKDGDTKRAGH